MEPLIHFKGADILNGESVVIYGLDMDVMPGDLVYIVGKVGPRHKVKGHPVPQA